MCKTPGEGGEIIRYLREAHDFVYPMWNMNLLISIITVLLLGFFTLKKERLTNTGFYILSLIYICIFIRLISSLELSLCPVMETHFRTILCWLLPILFIGFYISDLTNKKYSPTILSNLICIVLLCGITQSCWQIVNTYYWDKNIQYMKSELVNHNKPLYIPSEHPEIANFFNKELRRYIWHSSYAFTSILFSDTYEQKTLLMHYDQKIDDGNLTFREALYVKPNVSNAISIPFGTTIDIKNKYWDLTKCAEALDKYNKENNIQTWE
jgi:hypothetical protein